MIKIYSKIPEAFRNFIRGEAHIHAYFPSNQFRYQIFERTCCTQFMDCTGKSAFNSNKPKFSFNASLYNMTTSLRITDIISVNLNRTVFLALALAGSSWSASATAAPVHVEVVVFANHGPSSIDDEWFPNAANEIRIETYQTFDESTDSAGETAQDEAINTDDPKPVPATVLAAVANALDTHPDFELLNYFAWVQEPIRKARTKSVEINVEHPTAGIVPQYLLSGSISLYEVQALLNIDFSALYKPQPDTTEDSVYLPETLTLHQVEQEYSIDEIRQVQINEIHYFDHPHFGAIVTLVRPETLTDFVQ